jgi:hypothetical protein
MRPSRRRCSHHRRRSSRTGSIPGRVVALRRARCSFRSIPTVLRLSTADDIAVTDLDGVPQTASSAPNRGVEFAHELRHSGATGRGGRIPTEYLGHGRCRTCRQGENRLACGAHPELRNAGGAGCGPKDVTDLRRLRDRVEVGGRRSISAGESRELCGLLGDRLRRTVRGEGRGALPVRSSGTLSEDPRRGQGLTRPGVVRGNSLELREQSLSAVGSEAHDGPQLVHRQIDLVAAHGPIVPSDTGRISPLPGVEDGSSPDPPTGDVLERGE